MDILLLILSSLLYFGACGVECRGLKLGSGPLKPTLFALVAILLQAWLLHLKIDLVSGQNLNIVNMIVMAFWLMSLLVLIWHWARPINLLLVVVLPASALVQWLLLWPIAPVAIQTAGNPGLLFHVLLSLLTLAVVCLTTLQAFAIYLQDNLLKKHLASAIADYLPPLQTLERIFRVSLWQSFLLLTIEALTSLWLFHDVLTASHWIVAKAILGAVSWLIFLLLPLTEHFFAWRGKRMIVLTLIGAFCVIATYVLGNISL